MTTFNTLHIFDFGTIQLISKSGPAIMKKASDLTTLQAYIDNVFSKAPADFVGTKEFHAINTFDGLFADWQPKINGKKGFRIPFTEIDQALLDALITEIKS